jgi:hypothetical protein
MTKDEALKLALEALENMANIRDCQREKGYPLSDADKRMQEAITACEAALEAKDEPVAWAWRAFDPDEGHDGKWGSWNISDYKPPRQQSRWFQVVPLPSTTPPQRKPLTLGQKQRLWSSVGDKPTLKDRVNAYGLAIEAAHGIKGEA